MLCYAVVGYVCVCLFLGGFVDIVENLRDESDIARNTLHDTFVETERIGG